jgi:hypothetical protein
VWLWEGNRRGERFCRFTGRPNGCRSGTRLTHVLVSSVRQRTTKRSVFQSSRRPWPDSCIRHWQKYHIRALKVDALPLPIAISVAEAGIFLAVGCRELDPSPGPHHLQQQQLNRDLFETLSSSSPSRSVICVSSCTVPASCLPSRIQLFRQDLKAETRRYGLQSLVVSFVRMVYIG